MASELDDLEARLDEWRRLHIARTISGAERGEAAIEQEKQLRQLISGLEPAIDLDRLIDGVVADPALPRPDLAAIERDVAATIKERLVPTAGVASQRPCREIRRVTACRSSMS